MSSLFADLIDGIASFFGPDKTQPGTNSNPIYPTPDGRPINTDPSTSDTNYAQLIQSGGKIIEAGIKYVAPLISAQVTKPNDTVNPAIPASTINDPRVKAVLGVYGGGTNAPYTKEQSTFQLAFPGLLQNLLTDNGTAVQVPATKPGPTIAGAPLSPSSTTPAVVPDTAIPTESSTPIDPNNFTKAVPKTRAAAGDSSLAIKQYDPLIEEAATRYKVPPALIKAVIEQESSGDPTQTRMESGNRQSTGLMQILDPTALKLGVNDPRKNLLDPALNIDTGTKLLGQLIQKFGDSDGTYARVFRAYNAGEGAEASGKTNDPKHGAYASQKYYRQVARRYKKYAG